MSHAIIIAAVDCDESEIESSVEHQMEPFSEQGSWFKNGSRWDWYVIGGRFEGRLNGGSIARRKDLVLSDLIAENEKMARDSWTEAHDVKQDPQLRSIIYGINHGMTMERYIAEQSAVSFPAFLRNRQWHENERMGWFGGTAKSECQIGRDEVLKGKCLVEDAETGARIIGWNDPKWDEKYWQRFIDPLSPETWLVVVDYHV